VSEYLFVYGTLRPGLAPAELEEPLGQLRGVGKGSAPGRLYDLGEYPGAALDRRCAARVIGEVFELPPDRMPLPALDAYEGFDQQDIGSSLFVRTDCQVTLEDGRQLKCWIYIYNRGVSSGTLIPSGDYLLR
jgi:gamma-glutamylcyclotransferase (GGCT)/AIG2-like uncharacterized protein YtfP